MRIAGIIDAVGAGVAGWEVGQRGRSRLARRNIGGYCNSLPRRGDFVTCSRRGRITGLNPRWRLRGLHDASAARLRDFPGTFRGRRRPLLARASRHQCTAKKRARPGDLVAILGVGGSAHGHSVFHEKWGSRLVPPSPEEKDKAPLAKKLGAHHYFRQAISQTPPASWKNWAELKIILSTVHQRKKR